MKLKKKLNIGQKIQSTEKLETTIKNLERISFKSFDEELQIKYTKEAIKAELTRRLFEEALKTKEEILSIFK